MPTALADLLARRRRTIAGLMSGTSLDGVDAVIVDLDGSGPGVSMEVRGAAFVPYPEALREALLAASLAGTSDVRALSGLGFRLAPIYAEAVEAACADAGIEVSALDAVGCHGQTVHHVPDPEDVAGEMTASTLQIGSPSALAVRLGVPVVADFRAADVALGGQGAPLVPYLDFVRFAAPGETRLLVNLGGIANATVLPAGCTASDVAAFDTGPANMVSDRLATLFFGVPYDDGGRLAASGTPDAETIARLMNDPYLQRMPPKSTGRELYDERFVADLADRAGLALAPVTDATDAQARDLIATAIAFSAPRAPRRLPALHRPHRPRRCGDPLRRRAAQRGPRRSDSGPLRPGSGAHDGRLRRRWRHEGGASRGTPRARNAQRRPGEPPARDRRAAPGGARRDRAAVTGGDGGWGMGEWRWGRPPSPSRRPPSVVPHLRAVLAFGCDPSARVGRCGGIC